MTKRIGAALALVLLLAPATARAQIYQTGSSKSTGNSTVNFTIGYFALRGHKDSLTDTWALNSRADDDVLFANLTNQHPLLFEIDDFNSALFGGEYLLGIGSNFEAGVGIGYSQRTVPSIYADFTRPNGAEIEQRLRLKQIPVTFSGRFLFLPRGSVVEPYVGAGLVAIRYKYQEAGDFVAPDLTVFSAAYEKDGVAVGPTIFGGLRAPIGNWTIGGEGRWQRAEGKDLLEEGFLGDKLDLGGWTWNFTFGVRF